MVIYMNVVIGLLGPILDSGMRTKRWEKWRPTISVCQQDDFCVDRFELLYQEQFSDLAHFLVNDIKQISPETEVNLHKINFDDPWDFEEVYAGIHDFCMSYSFNPDKEDYYIHITTGTHVAQICMYLLTESRYLPGKIFQTSPPNKRAGISSSYSIIDLDLSKYDRIAQRFFREQQAGLSFLKSGIDARNKIFNDLIARIENVAIKSNAPLLLTGATGTGKTHLARKIFELKKTRRQVNDPFIEVNCATLRGDAAMSMLFGHKKGAFTGATSDRTGLLKKADGGMLFLDEIGELGLDEQAMLLHAIEEKTFRPVGSDSEVNSDFQLIAGTNRCLTEEVVQGRFREDLLARINLWSFHLPGLNQRKEDIEPNIEYELQRFARENGYLVSFNKDARKKYLSFATSSEAIWSSNFRDLSASITRMATLAPGGRIDTNTVKVEIECLKNSWPIHQTSKNDSSTFHWPEHLATTEIDLFEKAQLQQVISTCRNNNSLAQASRELFAVSRKNKKSFNDSDRLRKYLQKYNLDWDSVLKD